MRIFSTPFFMAFVMTAGFSGSARADVNPSTNQWSTFVLWSNPVLSASLKYMPKASMADEDYMYEEFDNHTAQPLDVLQAWLSLPGTRTNNQTHQSVYMSDMTGGAIYHGVLLPGRTTTVRSYIFECGIANLGLPPREGFHVELVPRADVRLVDGTTFSSKNDGSKLSFEWVYPSPSGIESIKSRFKELLAHPDNQFASGYYLDAVAKLPEVYNSATHDELLSALKTRSWVDGKDAIMTMVGKRFPDDPQVLAYFVDQLSRRDGDHFFSFPREVWNNPIFIEPLVERYEKYGDDIAELRTVRTEWTTNRQVVARLSAALLKRYPIVDQGVTHLSGSDLCTWNTAVQEAGIIGDMNSLKLLGPALDDKRTIPDCLSKYDSRPRLPWNPRVCDSAVEAILMILDGGYQAFNQGGEIVMINKNNYYAVHDRVILETKKRLNIGASEKGR